MRMPFARLPAQAEALVLNPGEKNFLAFIEGLQAKDDDPQRAIPSV